MTQRLPPYAASAAGFSLVETIMAMGITSTALLAVMGMLSTTLGDARESRVETAAGVLTRRIVAEARGLPAPPLPEGAVEGSEPPPEIMLVDSALQPLLTTRQDSAQAQSEYQTGSQSARAMYFTKLRRLPLPDPADPQKTVPGITRLVITVESPASAPEGRRKVHRYVTLAPAN